MTIDGAIDILWNSIRQGDHFPQALQGKLSLDDAYRVQQGILARRVAEGEQHTGWKIALSGPALRQARGLEEPIFGYLLGSRHYSSGQTLSYDAIRNPAIESELCLTVGQHLKGPGITRDQVLEAVTKVEPAFELISIRGNMAADMPLSVADNISQWGYVTGAPLFPYPKELVLSEITAEVQRNGQVEARVRSADVLDDQLASIAWLANALAPYDVAIEPGHCILTGSFTRPTPIAKGDQWTTAFSAIGSLTATFA